MNGGCECHGKTFCPDKVFIGYEDDVPVFIHKDEFAKLLELSAPLWIGSGI